MRPLFFDGVHPSMQTKVSHGWIRKGQDKEYYQAVLLRQQPAFCAASVRQT